jgi:hypothetical protein
MNDNNVFVKKRKRFSRGGNTQLEKRPVTLEEQAAESVGYNVYFSLSSEEQNGLISELLENGIISAKRASAVFEDGGNVWSDFVHDFEEDGSVYVLGSNENGKNQILAKITPSGRTIYFIEEARNIPEVTELLLQMADDGIYAKGGDVAEPIYVVSYKMKDSNKIVEKLFSDMDSAELFHETLEDDDDIILSPIVERIPETKNTESKLPEQPKKASLFTTAKKAPAATAAAKKKRERVEVDGIEDDIKKYDELKAIINNAKAEQEIIGGKLKEIGREKFMDLYEEKGTRPANFDLADGAENILLEVTDKYLKVDEEKAELLRNYDGLLEETTTYKFSADLLEKEVANGMTIGEIVSSLIQGTDLISEEDKARLIVAETSMKVKKGTINNLLNYENPRLIFDLIQPILALK